MVPAAEFRSYYGRPILKQPTWKVPDVPAYLYLGGAAGVSAALAALADATGAARAAPGRAGWPRRPGRPCRSARWSTTWADRSAS